MVKEPPNVGPGMYISDTDYSNMDNWAFHPNKTGTLFDDYDLNIAVVGEDLNVETVINNTNNAMINTGVDVFFVHPTILPVSPVSATTVPIENQNKALIAATIIAQGGLLAKYGRFFAPRYQQSTALAYNPLTTKELQADVIGVSYADVKTAFLHYLENYSNGNKIILAGHSQGSYLLGLLLRDVFDNDSTLRGRLITAALGGMNFVYANIGEYKGGWWENIPLCTFSSETGCIQNWTTFKEGQPFPEINLALPAFNEHLAENGLIFKTIDLSSHWFIQDAQFYNEQPQPLRYYIAPDAGYQLGGTANFIAFDGLYNIHQQRESNTQIGYQIEYNPTSSDQRPNDLLPLESDLAFDRFGYHSKDYHIYLWALMSQIDDKLL
ncbi:MAG: DUF3089 domain-containing protein [Allomuricauda sp.]